MVSLLSLSCGGRTCSNPAAVNEASAPTFVEQPAGLLASAALFSPDATWTDVQSALGGVALVLFPANVGDLLFGRLGMESVHPRIDAAAPMFAVVAKGEPTSFALALSSLDAERCSADLARDASSSKQGAMTIVHPPKGGSVACVERYVVVASNDDSLIRLSPYLVSMVPREPWTVTKGLEVKLTRDAMNEIVAAGGEQSAKLEADLREKADRERARHKGRAADFAEPEVVLQAIHHFREAALAWAGNLDRATLRAVPEKGEVALRLEVPIGAANGPAAESLSKLAPGNVTPLMNQSADAAISWMWRSAPSSQTKDAKQWAGDIEALFGTRATKDETLAIGRAFEAWSKHTADWTAVDFVLGEHNGLLLKTSAIEGVRDAVRDLVGVLETSPVRSPLVASGIRRKEGWNAEAPGIGRVEGVRYEWSRGAKGAGKRDIDAVPIEIGWGASGNDFLVAVSDDAREFLSSGASPKTRLGDDVRVRQWAQSIGDSAAFALAIHPSIAGPPRGGKPNGPILVAVGKDGHAFWLDVARLPVSLLGRLWMAN